MILRLAAVLAGLAAGAGVVWGTVTYYPSGIFSSHTPPKSAPVLPAVAKAQLHHSVGIVAYNIENFDVACGCRPDLAVQFVQMGKPVDMRTARMMLRNGAVPMLEIEPYTEPLNEIIAGRYDAWLVSMAKAVRRLRGPALLSFAPEANGSWYPWGYHHVAPATFVRAWRHVVSVFRSERTTRVRWIWVVNHWFRGSERISRLWPGSRYVDLVGIDGYYETPTDSFTNLFVKTIKAARKLTSVPVLISETAASTSVMQRRAIRQILAGEVRYGLAGFVWFDVAQHAGIHHQDWRLEVHPAALAVFRRAVEMARRTES